MRPARTPLGLWDLCVITQCRREHRVSTQRPQRSQRPRESAASRCMGSFPNKHRTARTAGAKQQPATSTTEEEPILPQYLNPTPAPSVSGPGWRSGRAGRRRRCRQDSPLRPPAPTIDAPGRSTSSCRRRSASTTCWPLPRKPWLLTSVSMTMYQQGYRV